MYDHSSPINDFIIRDNTLIKYVGHDERVIIPYFYENLTIGKFAFAQNKTIKIVFILGNVNCIEQFAFEGCTSLRKVYVENKEADIEPYAFADCLCTVIAADRSNVSRYVKNHNNLKFERLIRDALNYPNTFQIENGVLKRYTGKSFLITIPYFVHTIDTGAFILDEIDYPSINFTNNLKHIKYKAFSESFSARRSNFSLKLPSSVTNIEGNAFYFLKSLSGIEIPGSIKDFNLNSIENCDQLLAIKLMDGVKKISGKAPRQSNRYGHPYTSYIEIPASVSIIENVDSFDCSYILPECAWKSKAHIQFTDAGIKTRAIDQDGFSSDEYAFSVYTSNYIYIDADLKAKHARYVGHHDMKSLARKVRTPMNVQFIANHAITFNDNIDELIISEGTSEVREGAIQNNSSLTKIYFEEGVEYIENDAIYSCNALEEIYFPRSIVEIGKMSYLRYGAYAHVTIYGYSGTVAETFAQQHSLKFIDLNKKAED